uniref:Fungal lipase-like domain-containing protein n=1 Tax=Panagrolaimus superbus TaxID=310955 RepID=A0A914XUH0_9BILA
MKVTILLLLSLVIIFAGCNADSFDDTLRYYAFPIAAAAYSDAPNLCFQSIENDVNSNIQIYGQDTFECDSLDDTCSGYTAVDPVNQYIIISFRGTNKFLQLVDEGWDYNDFEPLLGGNVAAYFFNGFSDIWNHGMKNDFYTLKNKYPNFDILVTGHSLGGAMASIAAATIVSTGIVPASKVYLFTFGQPRTGTLDYANGFNSFGMASYRVVHNRDMVAHLPPKDLYDYYHHVEEIWYQNDMTTDDTYAACDSTDGEDPNCSDSLYLLPALMIINIILVKK